ncbi:(2Fe-2S)-binding protein [Peptoniphilus equinus]|uniref:(2Fe-2S)-binding protein n=1 Tax=Peptoniphilus equinus TaxID=3016343 RepID=A0ABY7QT92_9FIRM|nr:(2Fe-2S)-binding protein [Peptoniphilus equinus]WBW49997.1 (2Fe-2S)-binding protein [Peptoniphilus equinus]
MKITLYVNECEYTADVTAETRLIDFIREDLGLTGTKEGCSEGECGACTVIMNGKAVPSCMVLAGQANGSDIITVEGLSKHGELDILQKKFVEYGAVQCGFCSPGFLMSAKALLMENKKPTLSEIKRAIEGNLCRCTGFEKIVQAIDAAAKEEACGN